MIRSFVYFHGPLTAFQEKPHAAEVIARFESRWHWLARARALAAAQNLNAGRCGVCVFDTHGNVIEHIEATVRELARI